MFIKAVFQSCVRCPRECRLASSGLAGRLSLASCDCRHTTCLSALTLRVTVTPTPFGAAAEHWNYNSDLWCAATWQVWLHTWPDVSSSVQSSHAVLPRPGPAGPALPGRARTPAHRWKRARPQIRGQSVVDSGVSQ